MKRVKKIPIKGKSRREWLEMRKKYIGGSDAGAVCGVSPWKSPAGVYLDKMGITVEEEKPALCMRIGTDLEGYVARLFTEETGKRVRKNNFLMVDLEFPFMMANIDREVVGERAILECKTTNSFAKKDWKDGMVPPQYMVQIMHYLGVTGYEKAYLAVLIGNADFLVREIPRDEKMIQNIQQIEKNFWEKHIEKNVPPAPDGSDDFSRYLSGLKILPSEDVLDMDGYEDTLEDLKSVLASKKSLEMEEKRLKQVLQLGLDGHTVGRCGDHKITWKEYQSTRFDRKAFEKDYPGLYEKYVKASVCKRFSFR